MYYTVYKVTNTINDKIYIGVHKTKDLEDEYMGSGKILRLAQEKYGMQNFTRDYIKIFDNPEDMFEMEAQLVNGEFVNDKGTYNIKLGGEGGFDYINGNEELRIEKNTRAMSVATKNGLLIKAQERLNELRQDKAWVSSVSEKRMSTIRERHGDDIFKTFTGKNHTDDSKKKIGSKNSVHQTGEGNSQFGSIWIHNLEEKLSKKINKDDFPTWEQEGWLKGRKMKF